MCYYFVPDTTTRYGIVGANGKQSMSVYEKDGSRHTYIASKEKVDEFSKLSEKCLKESLRGSNGIGLGLFSGLASVAGLMAKSPVAKKCGIAGLAFATLSIIYGITKKIDAKSTEKEMERVLNEIKKSQ